MIRPSISPLFLNYFLQAYYDCGAVSTFQIQSTGISNYQFESFLKYQTLPIPSNSVLDQFDSIVMNIISKKGSLAKMNQYLRESRDRLLTRLMSGKIDVAQMDIQFPPSMKEAETSADA